jgi:5-methylcytosine-specific restriction endonuclease McrA
VHKKYNGKCAYCGAVIRFEQMQVDHLHPKFLSHTEPSLDNNRYDNLMPACRKCNMHKGGMRLELWRDELSKQIIRLRKNAQFDRALRFKQLEIKEVPIVFYFERRMNLDC